ncbi:MAG: response regulator [Thermodesulfobacteriota bacterium]
MRILIVEDDFTSRKVLQKILSKHGECDIAVNGEEAIEAFKLALEETEPYSLICMDIMMPVIDGQQALQRIREIERERNLSYEQEVKAIMITALSDLQNVNEAFSKGWANSYITKPIDNSKLIEEIRELGLIE